MIKTGIEPAEILLPKVDDMTAWACIACDQFTSEPEYWKKLDDSVSGKKSTLNLVLPEIYLDDEPDLRIAKINANIKEYLSEGVFEKLNKGFVLTVRSTPFVKKRIGLIGAVDLEEYEYSKKSSALIRSTEGTIEERIPPRLKIRENADVEFPHIMILFDDEKKEITEKLYERRSDLKKLYDFDLNMGGGHVEGYFVSDYESVSEKFSRLLDAERLKSKYGFDDKFAFAVGDGNHSLATAKAHWNKIKQSLSEEERLTHPARFALAEFVNIYDDGIYFEPIFRLVSGINKEDFVNSLKSREIGKMGINDGTQIEYSDGNADLPVIISQTDAFIKDYIAEKGGKVDYIHGEKNLDRLVKSNDDSVGILFDKLDKSDLFKFVSEKGAFPRKTFSMGEGLEKRYYLEGRKIKND